MPGRPKKSLYERYSTKIEKTDSCWLWTGKIDPIQKVGCLSKHGEPGESIVVHRYAWELANGDIPEGMYVQQTCGKRHCVNPEHLYITNKRAEFERSPLADRFWAKVITSSDGGCWGWKASTNNSGYGHMWNRERRTMSRAPQISWYLRYGKWPDQCVLHKCDNRICSNPDHLFLGTIADNNHDRDSKGRHGMAKLTKADIPEIRSLRGHKTCKEIGQMFGVSHSVISMIYSGKAWAHA